MEQTSGCLKKGMVRKDLSTTILFVLFYFFVTTSLYYAPVHMFANTNIKMLLYSIMSKESVLFV